MRVLVLGATGCVGSHVARALAHAGHTVVGLRRASSSLELVRDLPGIEWFDGALESSSSIARAIRGCQALVAAMRLDLPASSTRTRLIESYRNAVRSLVDACVAEKARLVHVGAAQTLAGTVHPELADERGAASAERFDSNETVALALAEAEIAKAAAQGLDAVLLTSGQVVGRGERHFVPRLLAASRSRVRFCPPGGTNVIGADDLARGVLAALERAPRGASYVIGGENLTNRALLDVVDSIVGNTLPAYPWPRTGLAALAPLTNGFLVGSTSGLYTFLDSRKAERELGWRAGPVQPALAAAIVSLETKSLARGRS